MPVLAGAGVDALDPERPEVALALLAALVGVDAALPDLLFGPLVRAVLGPPVTLGLLQHLPALLAGVDAPGGACHLPHPQQTLELLLVHAVHEGLGVEPPLALPALLLQDVVVARPASLQAALLAYLKAPGGALVGLHLRHFSSTFRLDVLLERLAARESKPFRLCKRRECIKQLL
jgi:hypothetical protein